MYHSLSEKEGRWLLQRTPDPDLSAKLAATFKVIGDPTRVRILSLLRMLGLVRFRRAGRSIYSR